MAGFMSNNPLADPENKAQLGSNTVQGGRQQASSGPGPLGSLMNQAALPVATAAMPALQAAGTAAGAGATAAATGGAGVLASGAAGLTAGLGAAGAAMAPMLAAAGPFALMALPFLLNNGTNKVPKYGDGTPNVNSKYGDDPFAPSGPSFVESQPAASALGGMFNYVPDAYQVSNYLTSLFGNNLTGEVPSTPERAGPEFPVVSAMPSQAPPPSPPQPAPMIPNGAVPVAPKPVSGYEEQLANYRAAGYNYGSKKIPGYKNGGIIEEVGEHIMNPLGIAGRALGFNNGTNMAYAGGEDTVPTMLTPGEAVIPAAAAQNPNNQPMIDSMIEEGRGANAIAEGQAPMATQAPMAAQAPMPAEATLPMAGPLSGPAQRAQVEALQDMAMKKKAFEAEEMRKQQAFEQKLALDKQKALMSMQT